MAAAAGAAAIRGQPAASSMGIAATTSMPRGTSGGPGGRSALAFLEQCHSLGAAGIQAGINGDIPQLRARAEQLGMYIEAFLGLPRNGDVASFEHSVVAAREAGSICGRVACLSGRRYETFDTLEAWKAFVKSSHDAIKLMVPILDKHKFPVAIENHKDWTTEEHLAIVKTYSSEYLGILFDFGNNIALLDDPVEQVEKLAPYILSTHVKDMGLEMYAEGFLLSELPLGEGMLDLARIVRTIRAARSKTKFSLEMITRDPLKIPVLTDKYWATFPDRSGRYLARTLTAVHEKGVKGLPQVSKLSPEEQNNLFERNNAACLRYGREKLGIQKVTITPRRRAGNCV
jgi:sugar phosphate isomerase/epimerase